MSSVERKANRIAYGETLAELAQNDSRIVVVDSDFGRSVGYEEFWTRYPNRYFNCGIAEQSMCSVAAGLSTCGLTAFASSFAVFISMRALDQVRNGAALYDLNVKFIGSHAGIETAMDGATHQSVEDIAIMRSLPHMRVLAPCCPNQTAALTRLMARSQGVFYMRFSRETSAYIYDAHETFELGGSKTLREGNDVTLLAHGHMVEKSLEAANILRSVGIHARVIDMYSIKPMDENVVLRAARETKGLVVAEDHSVIGGLAGVVCELLCQSYPARVVRVGMPDCYGRSGSVKDLTRLYHLTAKDVAAAAIKLYA
jgi:transketolase